jgi:pyruvate dehydrogenase E2 component (dihydrolipoamide acetyltransferase)
VSQTANLVDITMPRLSDSMEEATVLEWLKQPGEQIARGDPLVEVETDKATMVYEAELDGVLTEIVVRDGETAALGAVIARVESAASAASVPSAAAAAATEVEPEVVAQPAAPTAQGHERSTSRPRATPVARRLAGELGVALDGVNGTGPGGRIVRADVRAAAGGATATAAAAASADAGGRGSVTEVQLSTTQRTIARRMVESRSEIPEFTLEAEISMEAAHVLREGLRDPDGRAPSFNDLVVRAVALALRDFPALNASFGEDRVLQHGRINVGIAVATEDALLVPTILDADRKSVFEIAAESRRLADRANSRSLNPDELADGTFTVSNLGMFGVRRFTAVINRPQAAILAVGEVGLRPWVDPYGGIAARRLMDVSLSCDHRIVYGAEAARFLRRLRELLEDPAQLVEG